MLLWVYNPNNDKWQVKNSTNTCDKCNTQQSDGYAYYPYDLGCTIPNMRYFSQTTLLAVIPPGA